MFVVTNKNEKYRVWFHKNDAVHKVKNEMCPCIQTHCYIEKWAEDIKDRQLVADGSVVCFYDEQSNDVVARKMAFVKAVKNFSREDRIIFWQTFKENVRVNSRSSLETFKRKIFDRLYEIAQHEEVTGNVQYELDKLMVEIIKGIERV